MPTHSRVPVANARGHKAFSVCSGIGDAENDHDLLDACEAGAAVAWGSRALCEVADDVIRGTQRTGT